MQNLQIISADDHLQETGDVWQRRVPAHLRDKAPKVVSLPNGSAAWSWGNNPPTPFSMDVMAGRKYEDYKITEGIKWEEVPPGTYDPDERLKVMDADGVDTSVLPSQFRPRIYQGMAQYWRNRPGTEVRVYASLQ
jgi:hypothetical protein